MIYNELDHSQEDRIILMCRFMQEQGMHEMTCICKDNLDYSIGAYNKYFEIRVRKQVKEGIAFIDYCDFYKILYDDFELEYINSSNDFA